MNLIAVARRWREENGYVGRGGVIVLFEGVDRCCLRKRFVLTTVLP
ncbi:hypothetical protein [Caballeronia sordidicola]|uniref:Uncharacterized protein n=1 Tax=Caballeronia sordidicola TaxID=196367 RepID=A0A226X7B9_CABSO|nr:hypothetical protein [Caballeronia sordidicola]OXC79334.1 hypothetical protein BSU04_07390 [Caballeronia sordidicola]